MSYTIFLILIVIVAFLLILIIMVQNPKGGGLNASLGGGGGAQIGGVQNTNKFLDKATWTLAISLFALILISNFAIPRTKNAVDSNLIETISDVKITKEAPVSDAPTNDAPTKETPASNE